MAVVVAPGFKLRGRHFFLTYPRCDLEKQDCLDQLQEEFDIKGFIVAQEKHADEGLHVHVYMETAKRVCVTVRGKFSLWGHSLDETKEYTGNYQVVRDSLRVQKYCKKDGDFITNLKLNRLAMAIDLGKAGDIKGAMSAVAEARPDMILMGGQRVRANLNMLAADEEEKDSVFSEFINIPPKMAAWVPANQSLWLFGKPGLGKTEYARSLYPGGLLVRHMDQLKAFKPKEHTAIIFDDMSFVERTREEVIHLVDLANKSGINVKFGCVTIPRGTPRIFCSNTMIWPIDATGAIRRRVYAVQVKEMLFVPLVGDASTVKKADDWDSIMGNDMMDVDEPEPQGRVGAPDWALGRIGQ